MSWPRGGSVRWRRDVGYEYCCPTCRTFWPLTDEHWYPVRGMTRCRACQQDADRRNHRLAYLNSTTRRERRIESARRYRERIRRERQAAAA